MEWYAWLSKTSLEPSLIYEYGLAFTRNELEEEDISYFNHEFLQSMGISVAKHRLEILKLARKEAGGRLNGLSRLRSAINKTKRLLTKNISKLSVNKHSSPMPLSELTPYRTQRSGALRRLNGPKEHNYDKAMVTSRSAMKSGPLDRRVQEKLMMTSRSLSVSGPLDGKMQERLMYNNRSPRTTGPINGGVKERYPFACRSPTVSGPLGLSPKVNHQNKEKGGGYDEVHSLWSLMFQDMKPT